MAGQVVIDVKSDRGLAILELNDPDRQNAITANMCEAVVAVIEFGLGAGFDELSLLRTVRRRLAPYKVPKRILPVAVIPRNRMGKVLKDELRKTHHELFADRN